jgi:hypothetical protein
MEVLIDMVDRKPLFIQVAKHFYNQDVGIEIISEELDG